MKTNQKTKTEFMDLTHCTTGLADRYTKQKWHERSRQYIFKGVLKFPHTIEIRDKPVTMYSVQYL